VPAWPYSRPQKRKHSGLPGCLDEVAVDETQDEPDGLIFVNAVSLPVSYKETCVLRMTRLRTPAARQQSGVFCCGKRRIDRFTERRPGGLRH
jgi:hypothetical protein